MKQTQEAQLAELMMKCSPSSLTIVEASSVLRWHYWERKK